MPDDERPLTPKGERRVAEVARGLRRLDLALDRILTSPLPRALETAEIVAEVLDLTDRLETTDTLRPDRSAGSIREWVQTRSEANLMLVGHNPNLSELLGLLATDGKADSSFELRKGGIAAFGPGVGGDMQLEWLATPRLIRRLSR
jgi:phosphohistidine phosphatase